MTSSPRAGFTLVELLVVIAIIGVLAGLGSKMLSFATKSSAIGLAEQEMQRLVLGVETYQLDFGDYPPSSMEKDYEISGNGLDEGNESLVAHLASRSRGRSYFEFKEEFIQNLGQDRRRNANRYKQKRRGWREDQ